MAACAPYSPNQCKLIKLLAIGWLSVFYMLTAMILSYALKNLIIIHLNIHPVIDFVVCMFVIGIMCYYFTKLVKKAPFPLDGVKGYNHKLLDTFITDNILAFGIFFYLSSELIELSKSLFMYFGIN